MKNPRRSLNKVLSLDEVTKPFGCVFTKSNDWQPHLGRCLTLQVNNDKVSYPLNQPITLSPSHFELLKDLAAAGRNFLPPHLGDYDINSEFKSYEPQIS